jgi:cytochrome c551/c552
MKKIFPISTQVTRLSKMILLAITLTTGALLISCGGSSEMAEGKAFFQSKGCTECHAVSTFGLESQNKSGPDLADAYTDVQKRFGTSLENFLKNPTGTMQMVLKDKIKLTDDEKRKVIELLKYAHENKPAQQAGK